MNGKQYSWEALSLLPFIDEKRLLDALKPLEGKLTAHERRLNTQRDHLLIVTATNAVAPLIMEGLLRSLHCTSHLTVFTVGGGVVNHREHGIVGILKPFKHSKTVDISTSSIPGNIHIFIMEIY